MSKPAWIFGLIVVAVLIAGLYRAKYGARDTEREIARVEAEISMAEDRLAVLEAEVSHLSRREWIEEYARKELGMGPPTADQFIARDALDDRIGQALPDAPRSAGDFNSDSAPESGPEGRPETGFHQGLDMAPDTGAALAADEAP